MGPAVTPANLCGLEMILVIVFHSGANNLHWLQFCKHDALTALLANATGQVVNLLAVCQRGTSRL